MKVLKRILICMLLLLAYYLFFGTDKTYAYYVGQSGFNVQYTDLNQDGQNGPYNCTQQGIKSLCGTGNHYYKIVKGTLIRETGRTGEDASIVSRTDEDNVKWTIEGDKYKIGPYRVHFTGRISKVTIKTDQGKVELENNSSTKNGKYRVERIRDREDFYIYVDKSTGVRKIKKVRVDVEGVVRIEGQFKYEFHCYSVSGTHGGHGCTKASDCQILERYAEGSEEETSKDHVALPGALGLVQLHIYKRDRNVPTLPVAGAKYELWSGGVCQYSGTTDANGYVNFPDVLVGSYTIKEVYVPVGYAITGYATINGITFYDLTNMNVYLGGDCTMYVYNDSYIDLKGKVFLDAKTGKANGPPNGYYDSGDKLIDGIEVKLYRADNNQEVGTRYTDSNGHYEFNQMPSAYSYYVRFAYNGQAYESTTYNESSAAIELRSYATEGISTRRNFNNRFTPVNAGHTVPKWNNNYSSGDFTIYAYTGPDGTNGIKTYSKYNTYTELENINLGIMERDIFDMNLRKDLVKVDVSINGKTQTYNYPGGNQDLNVNIRGTDIKDHERTLRRTDLEYKANESSASNPDKLQVYVTYKIQIKNQSVGKITGYILDLNDYADTSYQLVNSYDENGRAINWSSSGSVSGNGKTYNKIHTTDLANTGITDKKWIYMQYKVSDDTLRDVLNNGETTEENFAEIAGYRNTYTEARRDTEGRVLSNAGENAGLIDRDSTPDNMNPTSASVQNFVTQSKTNAYQNLSEKEKTNRSRAVFEDDADSAPGVKLIRDDTERTISGTVFEDAPEQDRLDNNERIGNGVYSDGENKVNGVLVELFCIEKDGNGVYKLNEDVNNLQKISQRTNDGNYTLSGYIPGDYYIKFTYGDGTTLTTSQINNQMYTGQDYKSTIYKEGNYSNLYWYNNNIDTRINDAADDWARRQEVNSYSKEFQYDNATVLNASPTNNQSLLQTLADKTYMVANTANMAMEVEYLGNENASSYNVQNVDFGIIERPRTKIVLEKNVAHVKLTATDGTTIFDSNQKTSNLSWVKNNYDKTINRILQGFVQGTVDENLLYGSTLNVRYNLKITNESEIDYNEESYYYTGVVSDRGTENTILTKSIIEYVPNTIQYDEELTKTYGSITTKLNGVESSRGIEGNNNLWQVLSSKVDNIRLDDSYENRLLESGAFDEAKDQVDEILVTDLNGARERLKTNDYIELKDILTFTRVIARSEDTTNLDDDITNIAEIMTMTIDNGRRPYYIETTDNTEVEVAEIPGNARPISKTNIELDTGMAEILTFVVPFGANRQLTLIVVAIVSLGLLIAGIILIKKKVL